MKFEKEVLFLGISANDLKDGGVYYTVQLFEMGGEPVTVNVGNGDRTKDMVQLLLSLAFGDKIRAVFYLQPEDKRFKLKLVDVVAC